MKFRRTFKEELEKKVDALMLLTEVKEKKYTKKELCFLGTLGTVLVMVAVYYCHMYSISKEDANFARLSYVILIGCIIWELAFFIADILYTKLKKNILKSICMILGYIGLVFGTFAGALLTLLEIISKRTNVYHLYKYFYIVVLSMFYSIVLLIPCYKVLLLLENCYKETFMLFDWNFCFWIFLYLLLKLLFYICLKACYIFFMENSNVIRNILAEMRILFYMLLVICMLFIWGLAKLNYSENRLIIGFLNASTVCVLGGSVRDKISEAKYVK